MRACVRECVRVCVSGGRGEPARGKRGCGRELGRAEEGANEILGCHGFHADQHAPATEREECAGLECVAKVFVNSVLQAFFSGGRGSVCTCTHRERWAASVMSGMHPRHTLVDGCDAGARLPTYAMVDAA